MPGQKAAFSLACSCSDKKIKQDLKLNLDGNLQIPATPLQESSLLFLEGKLDAATQSADITIAPNMNPGGSVEKQLVRPVKPDRGSVY